MKIARRAAAVFFLLALGTPGAFSEDWQSTISPSAHGAFPGPRPFHATYGFGWSGFTAAKADVRESKPSPERYELDGTVRTIDLARTLWNYDVRHTAVADAGTLHPVEVKQFEQVKGKKIETHLAFDLNGVTGTRTGKSGAKTRRLDMPNLFDLHSALLFLRNQPLKDREVQRIAVYPGKDAYVATMTVEGRENTTVPAGAYPAIKLDLQLSKVGKNGALEPHRKFRRATIWISDDDDRLLLRTEAQIFIGAVFTELQSIQFDAPKPQARAD